MTQEADPAAQRLRPYLRALWSRDVAITRLPPAGRRAVLVGDSLSLPALTDPAAPSEHDHGSTRRLEFAIAAHAGAHLAHGRAPFDRGTLKPVQIALVGLFEDARVEWLACRELPGLQQLWRGFHRASARDGTDLESLLARLARALIEPEDHDPHPWVAKGRRFFDAELASGRPPFEDPSTLRRAASILGNDLGQMRVQFNARAYAVAPAYRDDNSHLWVADAVDAESSVSDLMIPVETGQARSAPDRPPEDEELQWRYPEWDHLIGCHRQDWVTVRERPAPAHLGGERLRATLGERGPSVRILERAIRGLCRSPRLDTARAIEGDRFHLGALVEAKVDQRAGSPPDPRVFLRLHHDPRSLAVVILIDASASTAREVAPGEPLLARGVVTALLLAQALEAAGGACAIDAFCSNGRDEVVVHPVKAFTTPADHDAVLRPAASLAPQWSTRVGAAVRHASRRLEGRDSDHRIVLLLTDGEPHDIDVHDPRYLIEDLRSAVAQALADGVQVVCADLAVAAPTGGASMQAALRRGRYRHVANTGALPRVLLGLLGSAVGGFSRARPRSARLSPRPEAAPFRRHG